MDILLFALFCAVCLFVLWLSFKHINNKAIKQMQELAEQTIKNMRQEANETMKEIQGK